MPPTMWTRLATYLGLGVRTDSLSLPAEEWRRPTDRFLWCEPSPAYLSIYKSQPAVRTVVDFLADNLAQLGIHVFRRLSDTDRVRVNDHPLQRLLNKPNEATTRYRLMRDTVADICIYGHGYWLKRLDRDVLLRIPPDQIQIVGGLIPVGYVWSSVDMEHVALRADEVVHFSLYQGRSPLETLRRRLEEDEAAVGYRTLFWNNGARLSGWLGRPATAPRWTMEQREQFREEWRAFQGASNAGKSPVLEDGMEYHAVAATAQDSQLVQTRKLTREEVAAAYHVPPAMIGITEAQGYGSLREQHRALYQDTLGPWQAMLEDEIELQLLADFSDSEDVYVEFNISQKLSGSFEEQAAALNAAVGSPWMTRNEARARVNLPAIPDPAFDQPVTRLDLAEGQAQKDEAPTPPVAVEERSAVPLELRAYDEALHPRHPGGRREGGRFRPKDEDDEGVLPLPADLVDAADAIPVPIAQSAGDWLVRATLAEAKLPTRHYDGLAGIQFHEGALIPSAGTLGAYGTYDTRNRVITLALNAGQGSANVEVFGGKTVLHELGHHVHLSKLTGAACDEWAAYSQGGKSARISAYAQTNQGEHFAEAYRAYARGSGDRASLKILEPEAYRFMASLWRAKSPRLMPAGTTAGFGSWQWRYYGPGVTPR